MSELKPCPCGKTPKKLHIEEASGSYSYASGDCCNEWIIEFRNDYHKDAMELAVQAWNLTPRKGD